ncbi:glycosyltransferase family 4 protein [Paenibacillaceae bacterium WGS1546]|uniref:glycosyltransferase family 4 protein n=1 Tax=Cohnella sp. WGS1546 TaxID=3366810 RepID=UPI00372D3332
MLKAAFITPGAYPVPSSMGGSVERVVEKVVPGLLPHVDAAIFGRSGGKLAARSSLNGVPVIRYPAADKAKYFRLVRRRLARLGPDVIQVENRPLWVPRLKRAFPKSRVILNLHSTTFIRPPYLNGEQRKRCLRAADLIQVNSEFLRACLLKHVPDSADKIRVNHLGVDLSCFPGRSSPEGKALREEWRGKYGWGSRPIAVYVGRLIPQKGVHHLLSALPMLLKACPDALVVIVGGALYGSRRRTGYVRKLHRLASKWRKHVHFQPYVPHREVPFWFNLADAAVVPSVGREAFGLVNLEAMAAELPVVATRAGGMTEIIVDGSTGYLVDPSPTAISGELASRLGDLLTNERASLEMGIRGRERVIEHFQWSHTSDRWLQMVRER